MLGAGRLKGKAQSLWRASSLGQEGWTCWEPGWNLRTESSLSREGLFPRACSASSPARLTSAPGSSAGWFLLWSRDSVSGLGFHGHCHQSTGRLLHQILIPKGQARGPKVGWSRQKPLTSESGIGNCAFAGLPTKKDMILEECNLTRSLQ